MKICMISIDVEEDLGGNSFYGVEHLDNILKIFDDMEISATLFVTGTVLENYPDLLTDWSKKHEISSHGYYHIPLHKLSLGERKKQLSKFCKVYHDIFGKNPVGFRAVQHSIDNYQLNLLNNFDFKYDSSVIPKYVPIKKYIGYKGKAPINIYHPSAKNYKKIGTMPILEIPVSPLAFGFPLTGTWIRILGKKIYKYLLCVNKPDFIGFSMHSWDSVAYNGKFSQNSGNKFSDYLRYLLDYINKDYIIISGSKVWEMKNADSNYK